MIRSMRHPVLRILVAVLTGLLSPLCCCQAALLLGDGCTFADPQMGTQTVSACCCEDDNSETEQSGSRIDGDSESPDLPGDDCKSCPSCQGVAAGTGLAHLSATPNTGLDVDSLATAALAALADELDVARAFLTLSPALRRESPHLRSNRAALRWHCALIV